MRDTRLAAIWREKILRFFTVWKSTSRELIRILGFFSIFHNGLFLPPLLHVNREIFPRLKLSMSIIMADISQNEIQP